DHDDHAGDHVFIGHPADRADRPARKGGHLGGPAAHDRAPSQALAGERRAMSGFVLKFRYLAVIAVAILLLHSIGLLGLAIVRTYEAYSVAFQGGVEAGPARPRLPVGDA